MGVVLSAVEGLNAKPKRLRLYIEHLIELFPTNLADVVLTQVVASWVPSRRSLDRAKLWPDDVYMGGGDAIAP